MTTPSPAHFHPSIFIVPLHSPSPAPAHVSLHTVTHHTFPRTIHMTNSSITSNTSAATSSNTTTATATPSTLRKRFDIDMADLQLHDNERAVVARISTATIDRDGEVLLSQGCDATEFFKSPTVFFNHDYTQPVGKCVAITRHRTALEAKTIFATRPPDHQGPWLPDTLLALFQQNVIKGFSVGFLPIEGRRPSKLDLQTYGQSARYIYTKWKLLEYSVAPLPANHDALALAVSKAKLTLDHLQPLLPNLSEPDFKKLTTSPAIIPAPSPTSEQHINATRKRVLLVIPPSPPQPLTPDEIIHHAILKQQGRLYA